MKLLVTKSGGNNVRPRFVGDTIMTENCPLVPKAAMPKRAGKLRYKPRKPNSTSESKTTLQAIKLAQKLAVQNRGKKRSKYYNDRNIIDL